MTQVNWNLKYEEQKEEIERQLLPGELMVHCIDTESFGGRFYNPRWVATSESRVYSLPRKRWLKGTAKPCKNKAGDVTRVNWTVTNTENKKDITVHQLTANYFCNKTVVEQFGEENVHVHHIWGYDPEKSCQENNRAEYLQYIVKKHHTFLNNLQRGTYRIPENVGQDVRTTYNTIKHLYPRGRASVRLLYDADGTMTFNTTLRL